jgi:hypothetical protein
LNTWLAQNNVQECHQEKKEPQKEARYFSKSFQNRYVKTAIIVKNYNVGQRKIRVPKAKGRSFTTLSSFSPTLAAFQKTTPHTGLYC